MTRDDIMGMAYQSGGAMTCNAFNTNGVVHFYLTPTNLERFAALVAAAEREACAKVCDEVIRDLYIVDGDASEEVLRCAKTIRKRGEVKP